LAFVLFLWIMSTLGVLTLMWLVHINDMALFTIGFMFGMIPIGGAAVVFTVTIWCDHEYFDPPPRQQEEAETTIRDDDNDDEDKDTKPLLPQ